MNGELYVAGAVIKDGKLLTNGGRVLGVTETADTLEAAIAKAYETVKTVSFENAYFEIFRHIYVPSRLPERNHLL